VTRVNFCNIRYTISVFSYEIYHRLHLKSHHEMTNTEVYDYLT